MSAYLAAVRQDIDAMRAAVGHESNADLLARVESLAGRMFDAADVRLTELEAARESAAVAESEAVHA